MTWTSLCVLAGGLAGVWALADPAAQATPDAANAPRLIIRMDDVGFCHAANQAAQRVLKEGVCTSISVIVNTPWLDEAVEILRRHPEVSVGVHLTLNAEWREYRWGPVLPYSEVPSLVDEYGRFFPSRAIFFAHNPRTEEVEKELRAQIKLALNKGLRVSYVDYHMGTAMSTPALQQVVEKLAAEFKLGVSRYFGEIDAPSVYRAAPQDKLAEGIRILEGLTEPELYLFVVHPGLNTPELAAMTDLNPSGPPDMAAHRQGETDMLCSPAFKAAIEKRGLQLIGYKELRDMGLDRMSRPRMDESYQQTSQPAPEPVGKPSM